MPKTHSRACFFFQGQLDDNDLDFYKHMQLTDILAWLTLGLFPPVFFIRQLCRIITISNSLVRLNGSSHVAAAALKGLCVLLYRLAKQKCFKSGCIEAHSHLR